MGIYLKAEYFVPIENWDMPMVRVPVDYSPVISKHSKYLVSIGKTEEGSIDAWVANIGIYKSHKYITKWTRSVLQRYLSDEKCIKDFLESADIIWDFSSMYRVEIGYAYFMGDAESGSASIAVLAARGIDSGD